MAGDRPWPQNPVGNRDLTQAAILVIGAGISGICIAIDLIKRNECHNFIIIEKSSGPGGTWKDNTFPGCCCDVESLLYSYSFEQKADWTRVYPGQEEILGYLISTVQKYDLFRYVRFGTVAEDAQWDDRTAKWNTKVRVLGGKEAECHATYTITSDFLVSATGQLNVPKYPEIPGIDQFKGKKMHSARWDWTYDLTDKRVAVIGSGCTAAQIVPEVAKVAAHLTVFQRSPAYIIPRFDDAVSETWRSIYKYIPAIRRRARASIMDFREDILYNAVKSADTDASKSLKKMSSDHLHNQLPGRPDLWEKLTPDYPVGCKRTIISSDYFPTLGRDYVHLETGRIECMTTDGIQVSGKENEFDCIVFATGFQTTRFFQDSINITGARGRSLKDIWQKGPRALYGIAVESLPNFAMLYGPNTNLGHNSIVLMIEAQSRYINGLIASVLEARCQGTSLAISPNFERLECFNSGLQEVLKNSPYAHPSCDSWYKSDDGTITQNWAGRVIEYQKTLSAIDWQDYDLSDGSAELLRKRKSHIGRVTEETTMSYSAMALLATSALAVLAGMTWKVPALLLFGR